MGLGANGTGQLGNGTTVQENAPIQIGSNNNWVEIATGFEFSAARTSNQTLWSWGFNGNGQLGNGSTTQQTSPLEIGAGEQWIKLATGASFIFGIRADSTLHGAGFNGGGQLGTGNTTQVNGLTPIGIETDWCYIDGAKGLFDGSTVFGTHSMGLKREKDVICTAGSNYIGQLGNNTSVAEFSHVCNTAQISVGIADLADDFDPIAVYPNPSNGAFSINLLDPAFKPNTLKVYNPVGQLVLSKNITAETMDVNLEEATSGIYFLHFELDQTIVTKKVLIQ